MVPHQKLRTNFSLILLQYFIIHNFFSIVWRFITRSNILLLASHISTMYSSRVWIQPHVDHRYLKANTIPTMPTTYIYINKNRTFNFESSCLSRSTTARNLVTGKNCYYLYCNIYNPYKLLPICTQVYFIRIKLLAQWDS